MDYLVGIDIGTSATKSILITPNGKLVASETAEYPLYQPQNGWAEQDPKDWWNAVCATLKKITAKVTDGRIVGIGLSGQMHSMVLLDDNNEVIRPAILWCDQRTEVQCSHIEALVGRERLVEITGNPALPGFTASKLMWVKECDPENFRRIRRVLLAKDYIRFMLTGEYATEVSDASGMQLLDVPGRCWSEEVCKKLDIPMQWLPKVYESPDITGRITAEAAALTGLDAGIAVAGGGGDNAAAAIGTGVYKQGKAFTSIGTSGVVFAPTDRPVIDPEGRVHSFCAAVPGTWHVMGVTQAAGLSLNWFRSNLAPQYKYSEIDKNCEEIPIGCDKLIYLPYLMGERTPILDSNARGVFFGLSARHTAMHMARSVMEGVSYSLYSCVELLQGLDISLQDMVLCGGGSKSAFWKQMIADVYGMEVKTAGGEGAALGAAILGGCAGGVYASVEEGCKKTVVCLDMVKHCAKRNECYMAYYGIYKDLYPAVKESMHVLSSMK